MEDDQTGNPNESLTDQENESDDQNQRQEQDEDNDESQTNKRLTHRHESEKRKQQRKAKEDDDLSEDEELVSAHAPSCERKTKRGGYAHTSKSKLRISRANKGNTPWNKGNHRSSADRAKISAGVRARNRAILLEKLKRLGMTEEQWLQKKKEIKYLRERVRRAKKSQNLKEIALQESRLTLALQATKQSNNEKQEEPIESKEEVPSNDGSTEQENVDETEQRTAKIFSREIQWKTHEYDSKGLAFKQSCILGGPGGLICCSACTKAYSRFLSRTSSDMDEEKSKNVSSEVEELLGFLTDARSRLDYVLNTAQNRAPTGQIVLKQTKTATKQPSSNPSRTSRRQAITNANKVSTINWQMTSAIDLQPSQWGSI